MRSPFRHPRLRRSAALLLLPLLLLTSACAGWNDMQFVQDNRLVITTPKNLDTVHLPFDVSWDSAVHGAEYAVFIDRYPMPPGGSLRDIVDAVVTCRGTDTCLEPKYLADKFGIHITKERSVQIDRLPSAADAAVADDAHYATIVLIDKDGHRIGESVWYVSFRVAA